MKHLYFFFFYLVNAFTINPIHAQAPAIEWQKCLGGSKIDYAHSIYPAEDGGYIVAGFSYSNDGDLNINKGYADFWIVKMTNDGAIQWQRSLGGSGSDIPYSIKQTKDEGYIVAGSSASNDKDVIGNHGGSSNYDDYWIIKLSSAGVIEWQKNLGGFDIDKSPGHYSNKG